jgi:hypothetical protein
VVAVDQANGFGFGPPLEHLGGTLQLQILDHCDHVAIGEDIAIRIFYDPLGFLALPFVPTGDTLVDFRKFQDLVHLAHRAGQFTHRSKRDETGPNGKRGRGSG